MKVAKVFKSGNSQAVRLPKEFQVEARELEISEKDGALILEPLRKSWRDYFLRGRRFTSDFPDHIEDLPPEEKATW